MEISNKIGACNHGGIIFFPIAAQDKYFAKINMHSIFKS